MVERRQRVISYVTVKKEVVQCEPVYVSFGELVKAKRLERGWTQTDLAEKVGLSRTSVTNIEIGRQRVLLSDLFEFARAFGVSPRSLFNRLSD
jgi:transcriptional regulator with XRE-family HTH domain